MKLELKEEVSRKLNEGRLPDETMFFHSRLLLDFKKENRVKQSKLTYFQTARILNSHEGYKQRVAKKHE